MPARNGSTALAVVQEETNEKEEGDIMWTVFDEVTQWHRYEEAFNPSCLRESELITVPRQLPELEVQARWFSGEFGTEFVTTTGDKVRLLQLGVWNREAGPDFAEAAISINGGEPLRGCIELDREVRDWERHGHSTNPDYESVVLHVYWKTRQSSLDKRQSSLDNRQSGSDNRQSGSDLEVFTRTAGNRCVAQVFLDLSTLETEPDPSQTGSGSVYQPLAKAGRCSPVLHGLSETRARDIIDTASRFRFAKKAARLARLTEIHGPDEALYQALAVALGYKSNKLPFAILSQRLPLGLLLKNKQDADALLFGVAGFIDSPDLSLFDLETRSYLRLLWGKWWVRRVEFQRLILSRTEWRFDGLRPVNNPHRRVAALLELARHWTQVRHLAKKCRVALIRKFFSGLGDSFWDFHYSFNPGPARSSGSGKPGKRMALIGDSRVNDMLANVFFPFAAVTGARVWAGQGRRTDSGVAGYHAALWSAFKKLPAAISNRRVEVAAIRLFGDDPRRRLFQKTLADQQGLLQIYEDFCMRDASDCLRCPFPEQCVKLPGTVESR